MASFHANPGSAGGSRSRALPGSLDSTGGSRSRALPRSPGSAGGSRSIAPVLFRPRNDPKNPLYYYCNRLASGSTSWIDDNPGRIFYGYPDCFLPQGGCRFYKWEDDRQSANQKELMLSLRRRIQELDRQVNELKASLQEVNNQITVQENMIATMSMTNYALQEEKNNAQREITKALLVEEKERVERKLKMLEEETIATAAGFDKFLL
ncbi:hypothetical protein ACP4OV_002744 [Aristida adscensionis]